MRFILFLVFLVFYVHPLVSQTNEGIILDSKTKEPLPFVNIGIVGKGLGTVSNENGEFYLPIDVSKFDDTDILQISCLGYSTRELSLLEFINILNEDAQILMKPSAIKLKEVVLSMDALVPITEYIGYRNSGERSFGYWKENIALGGELATKIKASRVKRQLNSLEFEVWENPSDSILVRINIYDEDGPLGKPGTNLNTTQNNILITLKQGKDVISVNLNPYEIYVRDDFFVSLELLKVYGNIPLGLVLAATDSYEGSYRTYASQDKWNKLSDINMAYYLETSPYVTQKKARKYEAKIERIRQKQPTVSGYAIFNGIMVSDVVVKNNRTKETATTDDKGRYVIPAKKNDILLFFKKGYQKIRLLVNDEKFGNAIMILE